MVRPWVEVRERKAGMGSLCILRRAEQCLACGWESDRMQNVAFRPDRTSYAVCVVLFLGSLPLALSSPWLSVAFLLPLASFVWVARARVVADGTGLQVCNGLGVHRLPWSDVVAFDVPRRGPVVLRRTAGGPLRLTALARTDLPALLAVGSPA
jgi:hypothetical protein